MNVTGIDHVVLYVDDVEAASAFYADLFDAEAGEYGPGRRSVYLGDVKLNFRPVEDEPDALVAESPSAGSGDLCLLTDRSPAEVVERLDEADVEVVEGPVEREGARGPMTSVYFRDPWGNLIEVATYPEEAG